MESRGRNLKRRGGKSKGRKWGIALLDSASFHSGKFSSFHSNPCH